MTEPAEIGEPKAHRGRSRRELIKTALAATTGVAAVDSAALQAWSLISDADHPTPLEYDNFQMNNSSLRVIMTGHHEADWARNQKLIEEEVANADTVIPEYRPFEYRHLQHTLNPLYRPISRFNRGNGLFEHLADLCVKEKKPVWVVDPEHNEQGANLRYVLFTPTLLAEIAVVISTVENTKKYSREELKRRDLLRRLGIIMGLGAGTILATGLSEDNMENDLRHVVSAELLDQLDKSGKLSIAVNPDSGGQKVTMFIPKGHWQDSGGIKFYLENPEARKERLDTYIQLFGRQFPSLFEARYYPPGDASGKPKDKIKLIK